MVTSTIPGQLSGFARFAALILLLGTTFRTTASVIDVNVVKILFDPVHYQNLVPASNLTGFSDNSLFAHYSTNATIDCLPPNGHLQQNSNLMYCEQTKVCLVPQWFELPSIALSNNTQTVIKYVTHVNMKGTTKQKTYLVDTLKSFSHKPSELEAFFTLAFALDAMIAPIFHLLPHVQLSDRIVSYIYDKYMTDDKTAVYSHFKLPHVFVNQVARFQMNSAHTASVSRYLSQFSVSTLGKENIEYFAWTFFNYTLPSNFAVHKTILHSFENIINTVTSHAHVQFPNTTALLAESTVRGQYLPHSSDCMSVFRNIVTVNRDGVMNGVDYFEALSISITSHLQLDTTLSDTFLEFVWRTFEILSRRDEPILFRSNVIYNVIEFGLLRPYEARSKAMKSDENVFETNAELKRHCIYLLPALNTIVEVYSPLPPRIASSIANLTSSLFDFSRDNHTHVHYLLSITRRLHIYGTLLPVSVPSKIVSLVKSGDRQVQIAVLRAIRQIKAPLMSQQVDMLLSTVTANNHSYHYNREVVEIVTSLNATELSIAQQSELQTIQESVNRAQYDNYNTLTTDNLASMIHIVSSTTSVYISALNATETIQYQRFVSLFITRMNWSMLDIVRLFTQLNEKTRVDFFRTILYITNYNISATMINDMGLNATEIMESSPSPSWRVNIKAMFDCNQIYVPHKADALLDLIVHSNNTCLDNRMSETNCTVNINLSPELKLNISSQLSLISLSERNNSIRLVKRLESLQDPMYATSAVLFYLSESGQLLAFVRFTQQTVPINTLTSTTRIPHALYSRMVEELTYHFDDDSFSMTPVEQRAIFDCLDIISGVNLPRPFSAWTSERFFAWGMKLKSFKAPITTHNTPEVVAVLKNAMRFSQGIYPRDAQVIQLLMLLHDGASFGRLLEVETGGGKSAVAALFAAVKVFSGRLIDIATSSPQLAARDAAKSKMFFNLVNISVDHIGLPSSSGSTEKLVYLSDVLYGDMLNWIGDALSDNLHNVKMGRDHDVLFIDEVDSVCIDEIYKRVQKSGRIPGSEHYRKVLIYMWIFQNSVLPSIRNKNGTNKADIVVPVMDDDEKKIIDWSVQLADVDPIQYLTNHTLTFTLNTILGTMTLDENRTIVIPDYLRPIVDEHLKSWVDSSVYARYGHVLNVTYVVANQNKHKPDTKIRMSIIPMNLDTGVMMLNLIIDLGVSQFLQIQNGLSMSSDGSSSEFKSYMHSNLQYKGNIFGVTGTIGEEHDMQFNRGVYGVDFVKFPQYTTKRLTVFPPQVSIKNEEMWLKNIEQSVREVALIDRRVVLIIAESIREMQRIAEFLRLAGHNVLEYGGVDSDNSVVDEWRLTGDIIVATNLAGRGTDIQFSKRVELNGGLHVIVSYWSNVHRVYMQAIGRPARAGLPGSAQLIINKESHQYGEETNADVIVSTLVKSRHDNEKVQSEVNAICEVPKVLMSDMLYDLNKELVRAENSPTKTSFLISRHECKSVNNDQACVYGSAYGGVMLKANKQGSTDKKDITNYLFSTDKSVHKRVSSVVNSDSKILKRLNNRDYDPLYFILAKLGFGDQGGVVIGRVTHIYKSSFGLEKGMSETAEKIFKSYHAGVIGWFYDGLQAVRDAISIVDDSVSSMSEQEVSFLEKRIKARNASYNSTDLTEEMLVDSKFMTLYELWTENRRVYSYEMENLQNADDFASFVKNETAVRFKNFNCAQIIRSSYSAITSPETAAEYSKVVATIKDKFAVIEKETTASFEILREKVKKRTFWNPAYLIRKALDMMRIHDHQRDLQKTFTIYKVSSWFTTGLDSNMYFPNPLQDALTQLTQAISLDVTSWIPHNVYCYIYLSKESPRIKHVDDLAEGNKVLQIFADHLIDAIDLINRVSIPQLQHQLINLVSTRVVKINADLTYQLQRNIVILQALSDVCKDNLDVVKEAADNGKFIRLTDRLVIDDYFPNPVKGNTDDMIGQYFNLSALDMQSFSTINQSQLADLHESIDKEISGELSAGGAIFMFKIESFELETDDDDWIGTIFSAILDIFQIIIGCIMLPTAGPFGASFAYGLISGGIMSLYNTIVYAVQGIPINFEDYMKSLGVRLAVNLVVSFISYAADGMNLMKVKLWDPKVSMSMFVAKQFAYNAALLGVGTLLQNAGKNYLKHNMGDIEREICDAIDRLISSRKAEFRAIFASDTLEKNKRSQAMLVAAHEISRHYHDKFGGLKSIVKKNIIPRVANSLGVLPGIAVAGGLAAASAYEGYLQYQKLIPDFVNHFDHAIQSSAAEAFLSKHMLLTKLGKSFGTDVEHQLTEILQNNKFIVFEQAQFDYNNCAAIDGFDFSTLRQYKPATIAACESVSELMNRDYQEQTNLLADKLKTIVLVNAVGAIKSQIIQPLSAFATGMVVDYAADYIEEAMQTPEEKEALRKKKEEAEEKIKKFQEQQKAQYTTSNDKPSSTGKDETYGPPQPIAPRVTLYRWSILKITGIAYHWSVHIEGIGWFEVKAYDLSYNGKPLDLTIGADSESIIFHPNDMHSKMEVGYTTKTLAEIQAWSDNYKSGKVYDVASRAGNLVNCQDYNRDLIGFVTDGAHTKLFMEDSPFGSGEFKVDGIRH